MRTLICTVAAAAALAGAPPASAVPPPGGPTAAKCVLNSVGVAATGPQTGEIHAGPLVVAEPGTLICSVHVNNDAHSGPAVVTESQDDDNGIVTMSPRLVTYPARSVDTVSLCTTWVGASGTLYWTKPNPATTDPGHWSTDPGDGCGVALTIETPEGILFVMG